MHYFIYSTSDTWISSGSNRTTGETERDQNFGGDQILEVKKVFHNNEFDYPTRAIVSFTGTDFTALSKSVADGTITNPKYYLRLYEADGNTGLTSTAYSLGIAAISESQWHEGTGKFGDVPKNTDGASWINRTNAPGAPANEWKVPGAGVYSESASAQTFNQGVSRDINADVTDIVNGWLDRSLDSGEDGVRIAFAGVQEVDTSHFGELKYFSRNTNTIYAPKLEVKWDDHAIITGSATGSLTQMTSSGLVSNDIYMIGLKDSYKESDKIKFRLRPREKFVKKTFSTSYQTATGSYIPEKSGSYSIKDVAADETIVPFSEYTYLSCDSKSNYFIQWLNTFEPDRVYKILYKLTYDDGQEEIIDNDFEFKIKR
tara:strand:- start:769 stop:1884 length:1116 start_codon:yes stop_codon:yes gene_type:complete